MKMFSSVCVLHEENILFSHKNYIVLFCAIGHYLQLFHCDFKAPRVYTHLPVKCMKLLGCLAESIEPLPQPVS